MAHRVDAGQGRAAVAVDDPDRFDGVLTPGVDEHIWHHVSRRKRGPKELTGMVDLTRDRDGKVQARLLDLVPGRSGAVLADWLTGRGEGFTWCRDRRLGSVPRLQAGHR